MDNIVKQKVQAITPKLIQIRRHLHQYPELGFREYNTAKLIADTLHGLGLEVHTGIATTGVVAILKGGLPGNTFALRADMDALPIKENTGLPFASVNEGVMHACGHDGHVAALLGAAMVLTEIREQIPGTIKFIFQPAEEEQGGAKPMIDEGVLEGVDAIAGAHLWPDIPVGQVGVKQGAMMACLDSIKIVVKGQGGHGAYPHRSIDAVVVAAEIIGALQTIASREINPVETVVVSIGTISGGYGYNIIADEVKMTGTVRAINPEIRSSLPDRIERIISGVAKGMRAEYEFDYHFGYPPLINDDKMVLLAEKTAQHVVGKEHVIRLPYPAMGGEDMAYYLGKIPGVFLWVGCANAAKGKDSPAHRATFDFDEDAIGVMAEVLTLISLDYLAGNSL